MQSTYFKHQTYAVMKNTLLLTLFFFSVTLLAQTSRPNILFLYADDHSSSAVGAYGNEIIQTPNMDQLADKGVLFLNTYNMGAWHGAVCVASRLMFNTGMSLWRAKAVEGNLNSLLNKDMTWAKIMENAGYDTYFTGKWHIKMKVQKNFMEMGTYRPGGMPGQIKTMYERPQTPQDTTWLPWDKSNGGYWEGGKHWSEVVADEAVDYLEKHKNSENPFFMYVAFNAPHDPRQSPKEYYDLYEGDEIPLPASFVPEHPLKQEMGCYKHGNDLRQWVLRDENLAPFPRTDFAVKQHIREYYAIISHLDAQIGRILQELHESGLDKNTIVIYTADHGLSVGKHGLLGKQSLYEHSAKPPLIISGPGIPENEIREQLVYLQDVMPTTLQWAQTDIPDQVDYNSLLPVLENKKAKTYEAVIGGYRDHQRMVRKGDFKLLLIPLAKKAYLFNLQQDPEELNNLFGQKKYQKIQHKLFEELMKQQNMHGDELVIKEKDYL